MKKREEVKEEFELQLNLHNQQLDVLEKAREQGQEISEAQRESLDNTQGYIYALGWVLDK